MPATDVSRQRLDLAGSWQLAFDPAGAGLQAGWTQGRWPREQAEWEQVPAVWNVTHPDVEGVGFYRKLFSIKPEWAGKVLRLHFGGASYRTEAWLNGSYLGSHEGAYTPFSFDVTSAARPGSENELVVRVAGLSRSRPVDGMILQQSPAAKQAWYYVYSGLWGEVYLETQPLIACRAVRIEPWLRQEAVLIEVSLDNHQTRSAQADLHLQIAAPDGAAAAERRSPVSAPPGLARFTFRMDLPRPLPWSVETPHLYQVRVEAAQEGGETDALTAPFGMREFTVREGEFYLNGQPIFLRGVLLQPNYPIHLISPPTPDMLRREITLMKEAGFNLIRAHVRPAPPGYLDLTDELGMLVYAENSLAWIKPGPRMLDHGRREVQALIERDGNHPSVVIWGLLNENRPANAIMGDDLARWARALDPTRVVLDNSGGTLCLDQDFGWADRTTVIPSGTTERQILHDLHIYVGAPVSAPVYEWLRTLGVKEPSVDMAAQGFASPTILEEYYRQARSYSGQVFVSELGCGGMADLDDTVAGYAGREDLLDARELRAFRDSLRQGFHERQLDQVFGSPQNLYRQAQAQHAQGNTRQIEALLVNPRISGYVITQLNDVAWEFHAGLLDLWRKPKPAYYASQRLNQPHVLILKAKTPAATCGDRVEVALTLVDRSPLTGDEQVHVTVAGPAGELSPINTKAVPAGAGIKELGTVAFETGVAPGECRVTARLVRDQQTLAESTETILTLAPADWAKFPSGVDWAGEAPEWSSKVRERPPATGQRRVWLAARPESLTVAAWESLLAEVEAGRVAVLGPLAPGDEQAKQALAGRGVQVQLDLGIGNWMGCYHWLPVSSLTAGLPAGGLAGEAYAEVLPRYVMSELGGERLAGSLRNTQSRHGTSAILWYSDIEAIRLGRGALFLCQYRIFEQADDSPLAGRLALNLLRLAHSNLSET